MSPVANASHNREIATMICFRIVCLLACPPSQLSVHAFVNDGLSPRYCGFADEGMRAAGFAELYSVNLIGCFIDIHVTGEKNIGARLLRDFLESFCLRAPHLHCFDLIREIFDSVAVRERRSAAEDGSDVF